MENLFVTENIKTKLLAISKWLNFFAILGVIGIVLMALCGIVMLFVSQDLNGLPSTFMGVLYLGMTLLYIYPIQKLFSYVKNTRHALMMDSQDSLEASVNDYHSIVKYTGIVAVVCLCMYPIAIVGAIIAAAVSL